MSHGLGPRGAEWLRLGKMLSADIVKLLYTLLPGFVAAWIFYGLTAHPRKDAFERAVQALIFTAFVQALVLPFRKLSQHYKWGPWQEESKLVLSLAIAVAIGFVFSGFANNNTFHEWLRNRRWWLLRRHPQKLPAKDCWRWTKRTSFPSEWYSALRDRRNVILHLGGDTPKRITGWPLEWPDQADVGHFVLTDAYWLLNDNQAVPLSTVERFVIPAKIVTMIEVMKNENEIQVSQLELQQAEAVLIEYNKPEEEKDGEQSTRTESQSA